MKEQVWKNSLEMVLSVDELVCLGIPEGSQKYVACLKAWHPNLLHHQAHKQQEGHPSCQLLLLMKTMMSLCLWEHSHSTIYCHYGSSISDAQQNMGEKCS